MDVPLEFIRPPLDWHALAPEITLLAVGTLLTLVDIIWDDKSKQAMPTLAGVGLLATLIPILTLAVDGTTCPQPEPPFRAIWTLVCCVGGFRRWSLAYRICMRVCGSAQSQSAEAEERGCRLYSFSSGIVFIPVGTP